MRLFSKLITPLNQRKFHLICQFCHFVAWWYVEFVALMNRFLAPVGFKHIEELDVFALWIKCWSVQLFYMLKLNLSVEVLLDVFLVLGCGVAIVFLPFLLSILWGVVILILFFIIKLSLGLILSRPQFHFKSSLRFYYFVHFQMLFTDQINFIFEELEIVFVWNDLLVNCLWKLYCFGHLGLQLWWYIFSLMNYRLFSLVFQKLQRIFQVFKMILHAIFISECLF